ncbi:hypothetical protein [Rhodococcus sp. ARC_M6]|uniref:hypothetical protein n=1 Tax=Rhodococcus sp. ARC_M6 TaxID=2928852 RepID=UPI001FB239AF|nr:hypothetical protein [Rhodococcus sp. ARC_M6]MCJ0905673.1 hypothetical protein [Rhodococcus sp. ARC_M6]
MTGVTLELDDIQAGVLSERPSPYVGTYLLLRIDDRADGRELVRRLHGIVNLAGAADTSLTVAFTYHGLKALGVPQGSLDSFAPEFRQGMAARAAVLGDVGESAPDHWEKPLGSADVHAAVLVQRVTWVCPACVGSHRALEAAWVIGEEEVVVALWVASQLGVVLVGGECERGAALPAPDHLGAEEVLLFTAGSLGVEVGPVGRYLRVQLSEHNIGAVAAQHLGGGHRRQLARLVGIAQDDLAGVEWSLTGIGGRATPLPSTEGWPIPSLKPKEVRPVASW